MKALWFLPFAFAAGAEGFALFAPYLILVLTVLHVARVYRRARLAVEVAPAITAVPSFRLPPRSPVLSAMPTVQPAM